MITGSCFCGAHRLSYRGAIGPITACHCRQCRKTSGHYSASFDADPARAEWQGRDPAMHTTPAGSTRAFCATCGSRLWFRATDGGLSIEAGLIDGPTGAHLAEHIFVAEKAGYYDIADGLPQFDGWGET